LREKPREQREHDIVGDREDVFLAWEVGWLVRLCYPVALHPEVAFRASELLSLRVGVICMEPDVAGTAPDQLDLFELDVTMLEMADPASLVNMTDNGCGSICEQSTCITGG
jgi:FxLD family lantipeptide